MKHVHLFLRCLRLSSVLVLTLSAAVASAAQKAQTTQTQPPQGAQTVHSFFDLSAKTLSGQAKPFSDFKGKVVLVVNTASECGYTPQYEGLEKLYDAYKAKGLVVLGFPSNDFGKQEPGTSEQIAEFCRAKFGIQFPMFEKVKTKGEGQSPIYQFVTAQHGVPAWNFHKYLIGKNGQVIAAYSSSVKPQSDELIKAIESALNQTP